MNPAMEHTEELPGTVEALTARAREMAVILNTLKELYHATETKKEKHRVKKQIGPTYRILKAIQLKITNLKLEANDVDHHASSPINDENEADGAPPPKTTSLDSPTTPSKPNPIDTTDGPKTLATPSEPNFTVISTDALEPDVDDALIEASDDSPLPPWILNSKVSPKQPKKARATDHAVSRFTAGSRVYCFGHLDKRQDS